MQHINPCGNIYFDSEEELCKELEKYFLPHFFGSKWKPLDNNTKEVWVSPTERIDYRGFRLSKETFIEVKNWFVTQKDMKQLLRYKKEIGSSSLYIICGGIDNDRRKKLKDHEIEVILTKDIVEIYGGVVSWM
jgi:hypothetical protein